MVKVKEDMTGWVMKEHGVPDSLLTVLRQDEEDYVKPSGAREAKWLCICACGNTEIKSIRSSAIRAGDTLSCGCLHRKQTIWLDNVFEDADGQYKIGFAHNTNSKIYVDLVDFDKVKNYCWTECDQNGFKTLQTKCNGKYVLMHVFLGFANHDHADRNELNNRRANLRPATPAENARNRSVSKANNSGVIGVGWHKLTNKWRSRIKIDGKSIELGLFADKTDAIKARLRAEQKYFGEFAPQQHLYEQYLM